MERTVYRSFRFHHQAKYGHSETFWNPNTSSAIIFKKELAPYPTRKEQSIMESRKKDAPYHMYLSWNYHATLTTATKIQHQKLRYLARQISLGNLILQGAAFHQ